MKYRLLLSIGLIALLVISSCKKDSDGNVIVGKMTATIDGSNWTSVTRVSFLTDDVFTITGTSLTGEVLLLVINGSATGTYNFPATSNVCECTYKSSMTASSSDWFTGLSGTVTLTKVDKTAKRVSGTFQFSLVKGLTATKALTNGVFTDVSYTTTDQN